jgi:hypothetical protein
LRRDLDFGYSVSKIVYPWAGSRFHVRLARDRAPAFLLKTLAVVL